MRVSGVLGRLRAVSAGLALAVVVLGMPTRSYAYDMLGAMRSAAAADASAACPAPVASLAEATTHSSMSDGMLVTLTAFVQSDAPADRRGTCLRSMRLLGEVFAEQDERGDAKGAKTSRVYRPAIAALQAALLSSATTSDQLAGALSARTDFTATTGRQLLTLITPEHAADVRAAALRSLQWPMATDVAAGTPQSTYDGPIASALKDTNDDVVIAALAAEGSINEPGADDILLSFARRPDPLLRAGAIAALKGRTFFSAGSDRLIENGLRDPDIRVRAAAIGVIAPTTPTQLRLLQALADHAPTEAERRAARERLDVARSSSGELSK